MSDMTPAQQESINSLLRILGAAGLGGAGLRAGFGVLRTANSTYDPPEIPKPLIVDMPYAARQAPPSGEIPLPKKMKELKPDPGMAIAPEKAAADPFQINPSILGPKSTGYVTEDAVYGNPQGGTSFWKKPLFDLPVPHPITWARDGGMSPGGSMRPTPNASVTLGDIADKTPIGRIGSAIRTTVSAPMDHARLRTIKNNSDKSAGVEATLRALPFGDQMWDALPSAVPFGGHPNASGPAEVPLYGLAAPAAIGLGAGGGYMLADKLIRAADRRGARKDVDAAQEEYRQAILNRITKTQTGKVAADLVKMASDQTPDDPDLRRAKTALDVLFDRVKKANPGSNADLGWNALKTWLFPLSAAGPRGATLNMGVAGALGAFGGYAGYRASRDSDEATKMRERIRALDKLNARKINPPVVARLVPVAPDKI